MENCLKVGILGAGNIAGSMAEALNELQKEGKACAYAVASRSQEKALEFARNGISQEHTAVTRNWHRIRKWT